MFAAGQQQMYVFGCKCQSQYNTSQGNVFTQTLDSTHLVLLILKRDLEGLSCPDHGLHGGEYVLVDQFGEALLVLICVAWPMDYSHLLNESALATLSGTCE